MEKKKKKFKERASLREHKVAEKARNKGLANLLGNKQALQPLPDFLTST